MKEEDIIREAKEIEDLGEITESKKFFRIIIAIFMVFLVILMVIPYYNIKYNPEPKPLPEISKNWGYNYTAHRFGTLYEVYDYEISNIVRNVAVQITSQTCRESDVCYAKALFYFVRDDINYLSDPPYEYFQSPEETLLGAGDCEDKSILLAFLLKSIGIRSRIVLIPGHAYVEAYMPTAPKRYKTEGWVKLDTTCQYCDFGEIPTENNVRETMLLEV